MEFLTIGILAVVTFFTRVINLLAIPIFTDEAIYIRWAQIGLNDPAHRYLSLTDGKQPLLIWLMYPMLQVFSDPLVAGRMVSVVSGVVAVVGVYVLTRQLFSGKTGVIASLLYVVSPFTMVYDRLALMDSLLACLAIWSLALSVELVRTLRLDRALLLGMTMGAGWLTKSSAAFFIYLLPVSLILFDWKKRERWQRVARWIGLAAGAAGIACVMYNSLRLSPWFYIIKQKDHSFIRTHAQVIADPFGVFIGNLTGMVPMLVGYLTVPITATIVVGILWGIWRKNLAIFYLFLWFLLPFLALALYGMVIFPRFMLFMAMPLFVIGAYGLETFLHTITPNDRVRSILFLLIVAYPFYQSFLLLVSPVYAKIPRTDRNQLFDDWPSGYGVREVVAYIKEQARDKKVVLGTEGTFGLNPAVYEIFLGTGGNVEIHGYWPLGREVIRELQEKSRMYPTYLVLKETQRVPPEWSLQLIARYKRGLGNTYLLFYQVVPGSN